MDDRLSHGTERGGPSSPDPAPGSHRPGCIGTSLLAAGGCLLVLTTLPALVAGCWGIEQVNTGVVGYGFNCHSQECVDWNAGLAVNAMAIVLTQIVVLVLVLANRRRSAAIGVVGAVGYAAVALWLTSRSEEGLAAYFVIVSVGCALLALGSAIRHRAREGREAT